jgi:hypothetical protein
MEQSQEQQQQQQPRRTYTLTAWRFEMLSPAAQEEVRRVIDTPTPLLIPRYPFQDFEEPSGQFRGDGTPPSASPRERLPAPRTDNYTTPTRPPTLYRFEHSYRLRHIMNPEEDEEILGPTENLSHLERADPDFLENYYAARTPSEKASVIQNTSKKMIEQAIDSAASAAAEVATRFMPPPASPPRIARSAISRTDAIFD